MRRTSRSLTIGAVAGSITLGFLMLTHLPTNGRHYPKHFSSDESKSALERSEEHLTKAPINQAMTYSGIVPGDEEQFWRLIETKSIENAKLLKKISWYCDADRSLKALPMPSRMYDIPKFNLSLTLIAKVASTSWVAFVANTLAGGCVQHIKNPGPGYASLHDCVRKELNSTLNNHNQPVRTVFVRDPWARLVSVYEDKILKQRFVQAQSCYDRWNISRKTPPTDVQFSNLNFTQFVTCITETINPEDQDPHWRPQYLMHGPCTAKYTHIGRLDDLENYFLYIMKAARPSLTFQELKNLLEIFRGGPRRPSEVRAATEKQLKFIEYYKNLSDHQLRLLQDIYKWDVLLYDYPLNPIKTS